MANVDALTERLDAAIEKADRLNQEAGVALEAALKAANAERDIEVMDSYQYRHAVKMLAVYIKAHNVSFKYFLVRNKKQRATQKRKAGRV